VRPGSATWNAPRRARAAALVVTAVALAAAACGPRGPVARPEAQGLRVVCPVDDAVVLVDDRPVGTARRLRDRDLPILPGVHRVEVRAERHFPRYLEVTIAPGARVAVEVTLRPRLEVP
jgi:predicted small lipoprotein YifL